MRPAQLDLNVGPEMDTRSLKRGLASVTASPGTVSESSHECPVLSGSEGLLLAGDSSRLKCL